MVSFIEFSVIDVDVFGAEEIPVVLACSEVLGHLVEFTFEKAGNFLVFAQIFDAEDFQDFLLDDQLDIFG